MSFVSTKTLLQGCSLLPQPAPSQDTWTFVLNLGCLSRAAGELSLLCRTMDPPQLHPSPQSRWQPLVLALHRKCPLCSLNEVCGSPPH